MKTKIFMAWVSLLILLPSLGMAQGGWITLPGQAVIPTGSDINWGNYISFGDISYLHPLGTGFSYFAAPVLFPPEADGLSVRQMNATVGDFSDTSHIICRLIRLNRYSGINQIVFEADTGTASNTPGKTVISDTTGGYRLIDNQKYAWFVLVFFSDVPSVHTFLRLYAVRIQYQ